MGSLEPLLMEVGPNTCLCHSHPNIPYFKNSVIFVHLKKTKTKKLYVKENKKYLSLCIHHKAGAIEAINKIVRLEPQGLEYTSKPKVQGPLRGQG